MSHYITSYSPTLDTNAYAANDHLGTLGTLYPNSGDQRGAAASVLKSVTVIDDAAQGAEIHFYFFNESPTIASSDNAALNIADAEMEKCIGYVTVAAADYEALSASSVATKEVYLPVRPAKDDGAIYVIAKSGGSPTYAADSLTVKFAFEQG